MWMFWLRKQLLAMKKLWIFSAPGGLKLEPTNLHLASTMPVSMFLFIQVSVFNSLNLACGNKIIITNQLHITPRTISICVTFIKKYAVYDMQEAFAFLALCGSHENIRTCRSKHNLSIISIFSHLMRIRGTLESFCRQTSLELWKTYNIMIIIHEDS